MAGGRCITTLGDDVFAKSTSSVGGLDDNLYDQIPDHESGDLPHGKHCSQTRESGLPSTCSTSLTLPSRRPVAPLRSSMVMLVSTRGANSSMRR